VAEVVGGAVLLLLLGQVIIALKQECEKIFGKTRNKKQRSLRNEACLGNNYSRGRNGPAQLFK
jgi:hypothetical protein